MKDLRRKLSWNGNEALINAAHIVHELYGVNDLHLKNWLEYDEVDLLHKISTPHKDTLLHDYISFIYPTMIEYMLDKHFPMEVINPLTKIMDIYYVDYSHLGDAPFIGKSDDDIHEFDQIEIKEFARKLLILYREELEPTIIHDIFTILFANKEFLYEFNKQIQEIVMEFKLVDYPEYLKKDGGIKRCTYIPIWLQNGVFSEIKEDVKFVELT